MQENSRRKRIIGKIDEIKRQIVDLGTQIEQERNENSEEDSAIRQELLDKREILEQQISELQVSLALTDKAGDLPEGIGKTFTIEMGGHPRDLTVVLPDEANPSKGQISIDSPLAQALIGKAAGDTITVETPVGEQQYKIHDVVLATI
ncbi:MAG: Transcription elongation factor GreA [candidate division WS6 bacterium OLB20]|uniref:Transcription elongation factor GreA n=1 Tax=candidate division WS6 bacterium OLB20 TaxID=1617426 RepID=A0A136LYC3_9BACT|nr:MAG: Transcription elongation factor GreA [candidate division WS6 bacterium OLB20]